MRKSIISKGIPAILSVLVAFAIFTTDIFAADEGTVTATVTVTNIALTVSSGTVTYGTLGLNSTENTASAGGIGEQTQTATNTGNVTEDFNIKGVATANWTLAGTAGDETYFHKWCTVDCDGTPTWTAMTLIYTTLATGITTASPNQLFDLQIGTPTATINFTEQSPNVTIQAVAN